MELLVQLLIGVPVALAAVRRYRKPAVVVRYGRHLLGVTPLRFRCTMKVSILNPIVAAVAITAASLVGISVPTNAQQQPQQDQQQQEDQKQHKAHQQQQQQQQKAQQQEHQQQQHQQQERQQKAQQQQEQQDKQQQKAQQQDQQRQQEQQRLSQQQQQQLINQQQQRLVQYRQHLEEQQRLVQQQSAQLQQEKRMAQYRFQQQYLERLRQQQIRIENERNYNYSSDPYFYTPPSYRYLRSGRYYQTNQYGAELLRRAVNYGYEEGFRAGEADREDRWASSYRNSYAYQDANYGYNGF
jgi:hypothetical protein